ncbi:MAG: polyprenol monophosphomannose synthase [Candidatus Dormibacteria bacterium]
MTGESVLVIIPTLNEVGNIGRLIDSVLEYLPEASILVVDDGSTDGTEALVTERALGTGHVQLWERGRKLGLGTAYLAGFSVAIRQDYEFAVTMDADFSHDPRYLPALVAACAAPGVDFAVGSRYMKGGGVVGWGLHRKVLSRSANLFSRTMLHHGLKDGTGGFRCYSRKVLLWLDRQDIRSHGYSALTELLWRCRGAGFVAAEVPIVFVDREVGASKISGAEIWRGVTTVSRLAFANSKMLAPIPEAESITARYVR